MNESDADRARSLISRADLGIGRYDVKLVVDFLRSPETSQEPTGPQVMGWLREAVYLLRKVKGTEHGKSIEAYLARAGRFHESLQEGGPADPSDR